MTREFNLNHMPTSFSIHFFQCAHRNLKAGFNSPGGYASVNHQHYHLYYLRERLYLETAVIIQSQDVLFY